MVGDDDGWKFVCQNYWFLLVSFIHLFLPKMLLFFLNLHVLGKDNGLSKKLRLPTALKFFFCDNDKSASPLFNSVCHGTYNKETQYA